MILSEITSFLESRAPLFLQESYDNSGLITGSPEQEITGAVIALDATEKVIENAISLGCNLVIAHHPVVFSGLKKFSGNGYVEKALRLAIKNDIAIYACHTNLDNVDTGVNQMLSSRLDLQNTRILETKKGILQKLAVFVPESHAGEVRSSIFRAGGGNIGKYAECSFNISGQGTFRPLKGADPYVGKEGKMHTEKELRIEVVVPVWKVHEVLMAVKETHPYEEIAYDLYPITNQHQETGAGMIGELSRPISPMDFLKMLKMSLDIPVVKYTGICRDLVRKVAVCGGSGSFLLGAAIREKADVFISADFKYHQFFEANGQIIVADIGHYESEIGVIVLLKHWLAEKFPTFATHLTTEDTNPVNYL